MRYKLFILTMLLLSLTFIVNASAEEIKLTPEMYLTISPPLDWKKEVQPSQMDASKIIWRKPIKDNPAFMLIEAHPVEPALFTDTDNFTRYSALMFNRQQAGLTGPHEKVKINGIEWGKINTETVMPNGVNLKAETYCLVKNNIAIQIKIMVPKKYWQEISAEAKSSLGSISFK